MVEQLISQEANTMTKDPACTPTTFYRVNATHSITDDARKTEQYWCLVVVTSASATSFHVIMMQEWYYQLSHLVTWYLQFSTAWRRCLFWTNERVRSYQTTLTGTPSCL